MMSAWHAESAVELDLPRLYELEEVARVFEDAGFSVSVANLKLGFVPVSVHQHGHNHRRDLLAWLDYYSREKVLLRFTPPVLLAEWSSGRKGGLRSGRIVPPNRRCGMPRTRPVSAHCG